MREKKGSKFLGASMYVPATRDVSSLVSIANGQKYPHLRSVIICTEDAVREDELNIALRNLKHAFKKMDPKGGPMRFVRVRSAFVLGKVLQMQFIEKIDGFVLPKVNCSTLPYYLACFSDNDRFSIMPTLETREVFDAKQMNRLRHMFHDDERARNRILALRIGGNDLLNCLRVRRDPMRTIYDTPVGDVIRHLSGEFIPHGFNLTAPVFEAFAPRYADVLREEIKLDLLQGLFGKTAIHPDQIPLIEEGFKVDEQDLAEARRICDPSAAAVFKGDGRMCEPTTHTPWARDIIERFEIYGVRPRVSTKGDV